MLWLITPRCWCAILMAPLVQLLISNLGWRNTFLMLGGMTLTIIVVAIIGMGIAGTSFWVASPGRVRRVAGKMR